MKRTLRGRCFVISTIGRMSWSFLPCMTTELILVLMSYLSNSSKVFMTLSNSSRRVTSKKRLGSRLSKLRLTADILRSLKSFTKGAVKVPLVVKAIFLMPSIAAIFLMKPIKSRLTNGSPPVKRTFSMPISAKRRIIRSISS